MNKVVIGNATLYHGCCLEAMREMPDNAFSLAIVDPPYGIGIANNPVRQMHTKKQWDSAIPNGEYFKELFRVSANQIIWGGNYFGLPASQGFIIWDKIQPVDFSLAMCEMAWTSIQSPAKMFRYSVQNEKNKIHPTQKPVQLYKWLLNRYTKEGDTILDTHHGSGSNAIACLDMGYSITAYEIDEDYFKASVERIRLSQQQQKLF
jgi:site-specific DNA-methyltransferase (adenine-specific)